MMRGALKSRRGAALIVVICVMAVMMTLGLTLLSSAGLLVANSQRGYRQEQLRIAATTLSDCVREALNNADAYSTEPDTLENYLRDKIRPLVQTGGWDSYASAEAAATNAYAKMHVSTMTDITGLPAGFDSAISGAAIGIYYIVDETKLASGGFAAQCSAVTLVVATTVYGVESGALRDGGEYTVKTAYELTGETVTNDGDTANIATWKALDMLP